MKCISCNSHRPQLAKQMVVYLIQRYYNFGVFTRAVKPTRVVQRGILNYIVSPNIIQNAQINKTILIYNDVKLYLVLLDQAQTKFSNTAALFLNSFGGKPNKGVLLCSTLILPIPKWQKYCQHQTKLERFLRRR